MYAAARTDQKSARIAVLLVVNILTLEGFAGDEHRHIYDPCLCRTAHSGQRRAQLLERMKAGGKRIHPDDNAFDQVLLSRYLGSAPPQTVLV